MAKIRLDQLAVQRGLATSREKAQRMIRAGLISVDGQPAAKPGHSVKEDVELILKEKDRFVGRGGKKMQAAFDAFDLHLSGAVAMDIGSSTGGFTDCMLQHGVMRVYAIDVGRGQLDWSLRQDPRVVVMEGVNARYLQPADLPERPVFASADVSFISLTKVLPAVVSCLAPGSQMVTLIKPQFEAGREQVQRGGVVRNHQVRLEVVERIALFGQQELNLEYKGVVESPVPGPAGNIEFLAWWSLI